MYPKDERDFNLAIVSSIAFVLAVLLGYWGWSLVHEPLKGAANPDVARLAPHFLGRVYLSLQLFVLHPQGLPANEPWQLDVARFAAPLALALATIFALTSAFGSRVRHRWIIWRGRHEIVCGAGVHGRALADVLLLSRDRPRARVVLVDIDPRAPGLQGARHRRESRYVADTVNRDCLKHVRVSRARRLIAVAGDDVVNAQIASTVRNLCAEEKWKRKPVVLVQVEDRILARFIEDADVRHGRERGEEPATTIAAEPERGERLDVRTFGANTLAAVALFGGGTSNPAPDAQDAVLADLDGARGPHVLLAGDHGILEAIVVTGLRRARARRLEGPGHTSKPPPLRITLIGDGAHDRRDAIATRWQIPGTLIDLQAADVDPRTESAMLSRPAWSEWRSDVSHAIVACEDEQASISIAVTLSHVLAPNVNLARVATQPENDLDRQLSEHRDSRLARIKVISITNLAWGREAQRVTDAPPGGRLASALEKENVSKQGAQGLARQLLTDAELELRTEPVPPITPASAPIVDALLRDVTGLASDSHVATSHTLVMAGLYPDLGSSANLARAARRLTDEDSPEAFGAWCEFARLVPPGSSTAAELQQRRSGANVALTPLRLKAAVAGAGESLDGLVADPSVVAELNASQSGRIALFAGGALSMSRELQMQITKMLAHTLRSYDGVVLTGGNDVGVCGAVHAAAQAAEVSVIGYAPEGKETRGTHVRRTPAGEFSVSEPVAMWIDVLAAARARGALPDGAKEVRLVAFPGGKITQLEIVLARALGATVASVDPLEQLNDSLDELLPLGAGGVLSLPNDAMTLRAFLMWPNPPLDPRRREEAAKALHDQYRSEHRRHKPSDDPALAPWERLPPALRKSNLAAVDDVPNKLRVVGKRLVVGGGRLLLSDPQVERLAEMEHGRYNWERLSSGWELGHARELSRLVSPYLVSWDDLDEKVKQWDRDAVLALDGALQAAGWGVEPEDPKAPTTIEQRIVRPAASSGRRREP